METTLQQLIDEHGFEAVSAALETLNPATTNETTGPGSCGPGETWDSVKMKCVSNSPK